MTAGEVLSGIQEVAETITATTEAIQAVENVLNDASRSVIIEVNNTSTRTMSLAGAESDFGGFRNPLPPDSIPPRANPSPLFAHASSGFLTGSSGTVTYSLDDGEGTTIRLRWDNPFAGPNEFVGRVEGPRAGWYAARSITGGGNKGAHMRFMLGEVAEFGPRQSDWRTCGECKLMFFALDQGKCQGTRTFDIDFTPSFGGDPAEFQTAERFGKHQAAGFTFRLAHSIAGPMREGGWRKCGNCKVLFFDGFDAKGQCPGRQEGHVVEAGSPDFHLAFDMPPRPGQQNDWRFCEKCFGLFFLPHNADAECRAGGNHRAHPFNYVLDHV